MKIIIGVMFILSLAITKFVYEQTKDSATPIIPAIPFICSSVVLFWIEMILILRS